MNRYFFSPPLNPPKGDCGGLHSPREALRAQRGAHPLDQTSSSQFNPTMEIRICGNIVISYSFHIETQTGVDWTEPGFGAWAYVDCITSHSEGGAGDDEMVPCSPLGGERGERKVAATFGTNIIAGVMNNSFILLMYYPQRGDLGAVACPRKALMAPTECCATRSVEHPPDNDRPGTTFQTDVSKENLVALMGCILWLFSGW